MTIRHHPSLTVRSDYAAASLAPGAALAVAAHLKLCPVCAIAVETMCGSRAQPEGEAGFSAASRRSFAEPGAKPAKPSKPAREGGLSEALESWRTGRWRLLAPGLRIAALQGVSGLGEAVHMLKARPRARLRLGRGVEHLLVLDGGFKAQDQSYEAGDFVEVSEAPLRQAAVDAQTGCTLLLVSDDSWPSSRLLRFLLSHGRGKAGPA